MTQNDLKRWFNELWLQRRQLVIAVVLGVSAVGLLFGVLYPLWGTISRAQTNIQQQKNVLSRLQQRAGIVTAVNEKDRESFALIQQAIPPFKEPILMLKTVEAIAQETGISLSQYDLSPGLVSTESSSVQAAPVRGRTTGSASSARLESIPMKVVVTGTFPQINQALAAFEESRPILEVQQLSITPARRGQTGGADRILYSAEVQLRSYYALFQPQQIARSEAQRLTAKQESTRDEIVSFRYWLPESSAGNELDLRDFANMNFFGL